MEKFTTALIAIALIIFAMPCILVFNESGNFVWNIVGLVWSTMYYKVIMYLNRKFA